MKKLLYLFLFATGMLLAGFAVFWVTLPAPVFPRPLGVEGMVVFTGGKGRVKTGLGWLLENPHTPLLISGVHPHVMLDELVEGMDFPKNLFPSISLDKQSQTTQQNVQFTKAWAAEHGIKRIGLVTSHYHMRRSLWLLSRNAPGLEVVPLPVVVRVPFSFYLREYAKLLVAPWLK